MEVNKMEEFENIVKTIPKEYIDAMKTCEQDPEWHAEGNVFTHTKMVFIELLKLFERYSFTEKEKNILKYAAVLHDVGKPKCSTVEDGKIRSHGHSRLGYHISLEVLEHLPFDERFEIAMLIKEHGNPNWILESENPEYDIIKTSHFCSIKLLLALVEADIKGRISLTDDEFLLNVEYFRDLSNDFNCYDKPYEFSSNLTKFCFFKRKSHYHTDVVYDYTKSNVIMLSGLPGTGKDTYINKNLGYMNVISLDDIRKKNKVKHGDKKGQGIVIQEAKELAKSYLRKGEDFVWNATNTSKQMRSQLIDLFDTYDAHVTIYYIHNDLKTILNQNKNRKNTIPSDAIIKLHRKLEIPLQTEAHVVKYIT